MIRENQRAVASGYLALFVLIVATAAATYWMIREIIAEDPAGIIISALVITALAICFGGLFIVNPNEARVLQLFGSYVGTCKTAGLRFANPFYTKRKVSVRVRNFETGKLKVNDNTGNPIEVAAVVVWRVIDTAEALFEVDDYGEFVHVQSESALRGLAVNYPYDAHEAEGAMALTTHTSEIAERLQAEIQERLTKAGVEVIEARISHLAYAPEIAHAMLQRQQASAIIAARRKIVDGAVGMVEMALDQLSSKDIVALDEERKASMVSNLLVVLCSDRGTQPVVNTGSLYQ
ncbi:MAG: SPFH domain-containing protein [Gemmatimonadota bacterium]|nr:MAG: SPFH domain-containing protein [Gemmatimonadota bacterium]